MVAVYVCFMSVSGVFVLDHRHQPRGRGAGKRPIGADILYKKRPIGADTLSQKGLRKDTFTYSVCVWASKVYIGNQGQGKCRVDEVA